jgi:uncharacterized membrane protein YphA (DoxX/SURF4 family)
MQRNKTNKILYWVTTGLLALFILPGIFFLNSPDAVKGMAHLGIPQWLHWELGIGKFIGGIFLILPFFPKWLKEWTYVAFGIDFISAAIGFLAVDGFTAMGLTPIFTLVLLIISYVTYHRLQADKV